MHTRKALAQVKGLSEAKVDKIREAALKISGAGFITGTEARVRRNNVVHISSGSSALDAILGGGIESGSITEAFGMKQHSLFCGVNLEKDSFTNRCVFCSWTT